MQERHKDRELYFTEQGVTTKKYVIPYVKEFIEFNSTTRVLEVGCGEGGNMTPFLDLGFEVVGVDISESQIQNAQFFLDKNNYQNFKVLARDIYKVDETEIGKFDFIFLRDVIEHIPNQEKFFKIIKRFLTPKGIIFFGFPPWRMPFGGHQQICSGKFLSLLPYYHILPTALYKLILKSFGESNQTIESLIEIKETGISISKFYRCLKKENYSVLKNTHFLINPNYETKFNLKGRKLWNFAKIPHVSDFYTTAVYCVITQ